LSARKKLVHFILNKNALLSDLQSRDVHGDAIAAAGGGAVTVLFLNENHGSGQFSTAMDIYDIFFIVKNN
jgi:hypothetical protein